MKLYSSYDGFEWDSGNRTKNWDSHKVAWWECEEVFLNFPLFISPDLQHSKDEDRLYAFGQTSAKRLLTIVFTIRNKNIRVISARDMDRKERKIYNEETSKI
ncbi:MAG: BrnT family toxin [Bacteroidetes bacterium]|nr:BrnT family toxin [Bacteroidota bacterium]